MRQWRSSISYLSEKSGKSARFTFNDVIGLVLVAELAHSCGLPVRTFSAGIDSLFRHLAELHPTNLQELLAIINHNESQLLKFGQMKEKHFHLSCCVVRLDPFLERIKLRVSPFESGPAQSALPFPPQIQNLGP